MFSKILIGTMVLALSTSALSAQGGPPGGGRGQGMGPGGPGRGAGLTPEQREAARERAKQHWESLSPEQQEAMKAWRTQMQEQRKSVMEQVKAGTLSREQAREQMKAWMTTNKPPVAPPNRPTKP